LTTDLKRSIDKTMIRGYCHTNLDAYKFEAFPTEFVAVPQIDDYVEAASQKKLRVVSITHRQDREGPCLTIELHLPKGMTIADSMKNQY
jgi:hypothetical protein